MRSERVTLLTAVVILCTAGLLPMVAVLAESLTVEGHFGFSLFQALMRSPRQWHLLGNSVLLASTVTGAATIVGLPLGLLLSKADIPYRRLLAVLFAMPLLLPPYVIAIAWFQVLGRGGLVAAWLGPDVAERTHAFIFGFKGTVLVLFSAFMPIVLLLTMAFVRTVHPRVEEAARLVGPWHVVLRGITVPLILRGVLLGALLVFLLTLGEFGVPMFLRYDVYAVESFTQFSALYRPDVASAAAVPLAVVTLGALGLERLFLRDQTYEVRFAASGSEVLSASLGSARPALVALVVLSLASLVALPLATLAARSAVAGSYPDAVARSWDAMLRSLAYAATGATLLTLVGFFIGYLVQRHAFPWWRGVDSLTLLLFGLPTTVMGIGLITLWNRPGLPPVYATPLLVLVGYLAQYTAVTSRTSVAGLSSIPVSMDEAARVAGSGWFRRACQIVVPLAGRALGAAWLVAYLLCLRDTGLTMMLYPPGGDTLPVRTFTLMANGAPSLIAALCVLMVAATLIPLMLLGLLIGGNRRIPWRPPAS